MSHFQAKAYARPMATSALRSSKILFTGEPESPGAIAVLGACGQVGFGKLLQLLADTHRDQGPSIPVVALDPSPELTSLPARIEARLSKQQPRTRVQAQLARLNCIQGSAKDLPPGLRIAWAIEAVPERLDLKKQCYRELFARPGPAPLLCSTTSAFTTRHLFAELPQPGRCAILHPFFPHHKSRIWELASRASLSDPTCLAQLRDLMELLGHELIEVADRPAFAADRIFCGLMLEAVRTHEGLGCPPAWIDQVSQELLGCAPFAVHNMIAGSNRLSAHCMELCHQEHASNLFALPDSWAPYIQETEKQWSLEHQAPPSPDEKTKISDRLVAVLTILTSYILHENIASAQDLDRLCTGALAFRVGPCQLFRQFGIETSKANALDYIAQNNIDLAKEIAPLAALDRLP